MKKLFKEALEDSPIIAAVKDDEGLSRCLTLSLIHISEPTRH